MLGISEEHRASSFALWGWSWENMLHREASFAFYSSKLVQHLFIPFLSRNDVILLILQSSVLVFAFIRRHLTEV